MRKFRSVKILRCHSQVFCPRESQLQISTWYDLPVFFAGAFFNLLPCQAFSGPSGHEKTYYNQKIGIYGSLDVRGTLPDAINFCREIVEPHSPYAYRGVYESHVLVKDARSRRPIQIPAKEEGEPDFTLAHITCRFGGA